MTALSWSPDHGWLLTNWSPSKYSAYNNGYLLVVCKVISKGPYFSSKPLPSSRMPQACGDLLKDFRLNGFHCSEKVLRSLIRIFAFILLVMEFTCQFSPPPALSRAEVEDPYRVAMRSRGIERGYLLWSISDLAGKGPPRSLCSLAMTNQDRRIRSLQITRQLRRIRFCTNLPDTCPYTL